MAVASPPLAAALAAGVVFAAVAWWLAVDRQVPDFDSGKHLLTSWAVSDQFRNGDLTGWFSGFTTYPPLQHVVGALGALVGGVGVAPSVLAVAVVFLPLLALGLYRAGTLIGDGWTGALAVIFAAGAPMVVSAFRAHLLEVAMTALVALTIWLLLESRRFERVGFAALAGLATGLGMMAKQPFAFFVAGCVLVLVVRGGWRNPRGLAVYAAVALAVAAPWYVTHWEELKATSDWARGPNTAGPIWSSENLSWYAWNLLNRQLLLPLTALASVGALVSVVRFARVRDPHDYTPELLAGALVGWAALTFYLHLKAPYYSLPLTVYAALLAAGWIGRIRGRGRLLAAGALAAVALANVVAATAWLEKPVRVALPTAKEDPGPVLARHVTLLSSEAWPPRLAPGENGDVLGLMHRLRDRGIRVLEFDVGTDVSFFNPTGLTAFARVAGIARPPAYNPGALRAPHEGFMGRQFVTPDQPPPCVLLGDGSGVFVTRGSPFEQNRICPPGG